jgi:glucuronoarabinoxylan endo-1,4-beta-xylanase
LTGAAVQWDAIHSATTGTRTLRFRYALASGTRNLDVTVNGVKLVSLSAFGATGSWSAWGEKTILVPLDAGNNSLRLETTGTGGPNLDHVSLAPGSP